MNLDKNSLKHILSVASNHLIENSDDFSDLDSKFGNGNHGIIICKIASTIQNSLSLLDKDISIKLFFNTLGASIMNLNDGFITSLWGTLFAGFASNLQDEKELSINDFKKMFAGGLDEMEYITTAEVGDKTIMDTLIFAVDASTYSITDDIHEFFAEIANAGEKGAENTKKYISKFGRTKHYKDKTIGYKDVGATSLACFFRGLELGFN